MVPFCAAADSMLAPTWRTRAGDRQRLWDSNSGTLAHEAAPRECAWNPHCTPCSGNPGQVGNPGPEGGVPVWTREGGGGAGRGLGPPCGPNARLALLCSSPDPSLLPSATDASGRLACGVFLPPLIKYLWGTLTCSRQDFSQPFLPRHVALPAARPLTPPPGLTLPERTDSPPSHFHKGTEQEVAQGWGRPQPPHRHRGPDQMLRRQQDVMTEKDEDRDKGFLLKRLKCGSPQCCK